MSSQKTLQYNLLLYSGHVDPHYVHPPAGMLHQIHSIPRFERIFMFRPKNPYCGELALVFSVEAQQFVVYQ